MDNITHTLIGITAGHWAVQTQAPPKSEMHGLTRRRLFLWASVIGNNFPDLDVLYAWITPGALGNLLHHRGHTHTFAGIIPQWLFVAFLFWLCRKRFGFLELTKSDWIKGATLGAFGFFLHIMADSMNSYGVHPFFPFWNGWIYGDAIFIIEPVLWAIFAASGFHVGRNRLKVLPVLLLFVLLAFGLYQEFLGRTTVVTVVALFGVLFYFFKNRQASAPRLASVLAAVFVIMSFTFGFRLRKAFVQKNSATERLLDVALSPVPANPLCWFVIKVAVTQDEYLVRRGIASILPAVIEPSACPNLGRLEFGLIEDVESVGHAKVFWSEEHRTRLTQFKILGTDCYLRAWMRFSRVPFVQDGYATDLRFSRRRLSNFSDLEYENKKCPPYIPPWLPPRQDLIELVGGTHWF